MLRTQRPCSSFRKTIGSRLLRGKRCWCWASGNSSPPLSRRSFEKDTSYVEKTFDATSLISAHVMLKDNRKLISFEAKMTCSLSSGKERTSCEYASFAQNQIAKSASSSPVLLRNQKARPSVQGSSPLDWQRRWVCVGLRHAALQPSSV
jgi:hypothetical protein